MERGGRGTDRKMRKKRPHQFIAIAFLFIGGLLGFMALEKCWLWAWPAANCVWVGLAYFGVGGRVFGKRNDGTLNWGAVILLLPFLIINWSTWYVQNFVSSENAVDEVAPGLWLGRRVFRDQLPEGVTLVVDMTSEFANPGYGVSYLAVPTLDAFVPEKNAFLSAVVRAAEHSGGVLIYCANGHGRSAVMMGAVLLKKGLAKSVAHAEEMIIAARPLSAWHPAQRVFLNQIEREIQHG